MSDARIREIQRRFTVLNDWTITLGTDCRLDGSPYTASTCINREEKTALIYPWHGDSPEPDDYVLHEMLHVVASAIEGDKEAEEIAVQDICVMIDQSKAQA